MDRNTSKKSKNVASPRERGRRASSFAAQPTSSPARFSTAVIKNQAANTTKAKTKPASATKSKAAAKPTSAAKGKSSNASKSTPKEAKPSASAKIKTTTKATSASKTKLASKTQATAQTKSATKSSSASGPVKKTQAAGSKFKRTENEKCYWLLKSEPQVFSISDLEALPKKTTNWDGVRNFQARNTLRDEMKVGDLAFFYHSNSDPPAIAGIVKIVREGYPDFTAFDEDDHHYDPKSKKDSPTWYMVDVQHVETFKHTIGLDELRKIDGLDNMVLLQKGSRLSVQPVSPKQFEIIVAHARKK